MEKKSKVLVSAEWRITFGTIAFVLGLTMSACSGFDFYNPESSIIWAVLSISGTLLGIGLVKKRK